jgi:hypothetical protein
LFDHLQPESRAGSLQYIFLWDFLQHALQSLSLGLQMRVFLDVHGVLPEAVRPVKWLPARASSAGLKSTCT